MYLVSNFSKPTLQQLRLLNFSYQTVPIVRENGKETVFFIFFSLLELITKTTIQLVVYFKF